MQTATGIVWLGLLGALLPIVALAACEEKTPCQELLLKEEERCERCGGCEDWDLPEQDEVLCPDDVWELNECLAPCMDTPCTGTDYRECFEKCYSAYIDAEG